MLQVVTQQVSPILEYPRLSAIAPEQVPLLTRHPLVNKELSPKDDECPDEPDENVHHTSTFLVATAIATRKVTKQQSSKDNTNETQRNEKPQAHSNRHIHWDSSLAVK